MKMVSLKAVIPVAGLGMHMLPATKGHSERDVADRRQANGAVHC